MEKQNIIITAEDVLEKLKEEYPDKQPMKELTPYEQGVLVGCKMVVQHVERLAE